MTGDRRYAQALRPACARVIERYRFELPLPGADQVLVAVRACGICGSDLRLYRNGSGAGTYFGHEFSGLVVEAGSAVGDFLVGDRVAGGMFRGCGVCPACRSGSPNFCAHSRSPFAPGGFSDLCMVSCAGGSRFLTRLPDELNDVEATLIEPLSCAMRIHERAGAKDGDRVLVIGLGMMGLLCGLLLKRSLPRVRIVGADTNPDRSALCRRLGFDSSVVLGAAVPEHIDGLEPDFDVVIDATGVSPVFPLALRMARVGGTVVLGGVPEKAIDFSPLVIFRRELTVKCAKGPYPFVDGTGRSSAAGILLSNELPWLDLVEVFPLADASSAFRRADEGSVLKSVIVWPES
jgi:threonine dehydrogenase-like Zn-dependent dehydrogenase